jgi:hypothetical protein
MRFAANWATSFTWAGYVLQPIGRRVLSGLDMSRSQWVMSITWAGYVSQPMGDEHYLGWIKNAQKIPVFFQ